MQLPVLVSACLLGCPCRWHGRPVPISAAVRRLLRGKTVMPVCPEVLGGLSIPRPPVKRLRGRIYCTHPDKARRRTVTGRDVTAAFERGARAVCEIAKREEIKRAILCKWSPSCDASGRTGRALASMGVQIINTW
jgi:uncharacterized protein YbbK (DUF523 family)